MSALSRVGGGVNRCTVGGLETGSRAEVGGGGLQWLLEPGGGGKCRGSLHTILQRQGGWERVYHGSSLVSACRHLDCSTHVGVAWEGVEAEEEGGVGVAAEASEEEKGENRCVFLNSSCRDGGEILPCPAGGQPRSFQPLLSFGSPATFFLHTVEEAWARHAWRYFAAWLR